MGDTPREQIDAAISQLNQSIAAGEFKMPYYVDGMLRYAHPEPVEFYSRPGRETAADSKLDCICPEIHYPVCGADGQTYGNGCAAGCAGVRVGHDGECKTDTSADQKTRSTAVVIIVVAAVLTLVLSFAVYWAVVPAPARPTGHSLASAPQAGTGASTQALHRARVQQQQQQQQQFAEVQFVEPLKQPSFPSAAI